jgi:hypothetical protein
VYYLLHCNFMIEYRASLYNPARTVLKIFTRLFVVFTIRRGKFSSHCQPRIIVVGENTQQRRRTICSQPKSRMNNNHLITPSAF